MQSLTLIYMHLHPYALVALGGAIGSVLRWMISIRLDDSLGRLPLGHEGFAWPTLLVNILGCLAIGWIAGHRKHSLDVWHFWIVGVLGGFTTFSTFVLETSWQIQAANWPYTIFYVLATFGACYVATAYTLKKSEQRSDR
jgi:fluoride exporter